MTTKRIFGRAEMEKRFGRLTFGKALEAWRVCDELSIRSFAKTLGISAASLADIETGRRIPSPARAAKIALKMGHPPEFWVGLALADLLHKQKLSMKVTVSAA